MTKDRQIIADQIKIITPFDDLERDCQARTLDWIAADKYIYRLQKPDVPKKHLVTYFAALDLAKNRILLVHHNLANAWLPTGGHIDPQEDPRLTVQRECREEIGVKAVFLHDKKPLFISETQVIDGELRDVVHTDVSLWYLLDVPEQTPLTIEPNKFSDVKWWDIREVISTPVEQFGPEVPRFVRKLRHVLGAGF